MEKNKEIYTMKDVVGIVGLSEHTIRNYTKEFNIQLEKTDGGHRRFTEESIKQLNTVKKLKEEHGYSIKQIRAFLNGETLEVMLDNPDTRTSLEKKVEELTEKVDNLVQVNMTLGKLIDEERKLRKEDKDFYLQEMREQRELLLESNKQKTANEKLLLDTVEELKSTKKRGFFEKLFNK